MTGLRSDFPEEFENPVDASIVPKTAQELRLFRNELLTSPG
jgi:hypothetical protein